MLSTVLVALPSSTSSVESIIAAPAAKFSVPDVRPIESMCRGTEVSNVLVSAALLPREPQLAPKSSPEGIREVPSPPVTLTDPGADKAVASLRLFLVPFRGLES